MGLFETKRKGFSLSFLKFISVLSLGWEKKRKEGGLLFLCATRAGWLAGCYSYFDNSPPSKSLKVKGKTRSWASEAGSPPSIFRSGWHRRPAGKPERGMKWQRRSEIVELSHADSHSLKSPAKIIDIVKWKKRSAQPQSALSIIHQKKVQGGFSRKETVVWVRRLQLSDCKTGHFTFLFRGNPAYYLRHPTKGAATRKKKNLLFVMSDEREFV